MSEARALAPERGTLGAAVKRVVISFAGVLEQASNEAAHAAAAIAELPDSQHLEPEDPFAVHALIGSLELASHQWDLIVLSALADAHEALATALRLAHPEGLPYPTAGLAARVIGAYASERAQLRRDLTVHTSPLGGLVHVASHGPFPERTIQPTPALWAALVGVDEWPPGVRPDRRQVSSAGFDRPTKRDAESPLGRILESQGRWNVVIRTDDPEAAAHRVALLAQHLHKSWIHLHVSEPTANDIADISVHALARGDLPVVIANESESIDLSERHHALGPLILCATPQTRVTPGSHPLHEVRFERLDPLDRCDMWQALAGAAGEAIANVAGPWIDPTLASQALSDAQAIAALDGRSPDAHEIIAGVRSRARPNLPAAVRVVTPQATRESLVVDDAVARALDHAIDRIRHQTRVHDQWGLSPGRRGGGGARVLLAGPPGTGKTLAAEVMAHRLGVELLIVDLAKVVSKWLGETEKNLAAVFDAAERSQAVLVFDEADALFARRTEVNDSRDRYANVETAYLLTRLERFEGLTVLTTNARPHIDPAFIRRLDVVVDIPEPSAEQRRALWSVHLPPTAPIAADVDIAELADRYPLVGGVIRNAALSAAFIAARSGTTIDRTALVDAIERECLKSGRPFPGRPHDIRPATTSGFPS